MPDIRRDAKQIRFFVRLFLKTSLFDGRHRDGHGTLTALDALSTALRFALFTDGGKYGG